MNTKLFTYLGVVVILSKTSFAAPALHAVDGATFPLVFLHPDRWNHESEQGPMAFTTTSSSSVDKPTATVPPIALDPNKPKWDEHSHGPFEPTRGRLGAPMMGPHNIPVEKQNADLMAPPSTDHGRV
ncbi:hypothetical protein DXG03_008704, partial [Asterophora parasitica]